MPSKDSTHFDQYTEQNRVKHDLLSKYFSAYLKALSRHANAFHYIDGFAGRGGYENDARGSPLIALDLLLAQSKPSAISLVESNTKYFNELLASISTHPRIGALVEPPVILRGELQDHMETILTQPVYQSHRPVATFAFIDPCGLKGIRLQDIVAILRLQFGECLIFWNYDGLNRWIGGVARESHSIERLQPVFGSLEAVHLALEIVQSTRSPSEKERELRDMFMESIRKQSGAKFILPFRFQARDSNRTSHYLIHCSQHALGFKIMKEIMGSTASSAGDFDTFELLGESDVSEQLSMFLPIADEKARQAILTRLSAGPAAVSEFTKKWVERPTDYLSAKDYKRILVDLEQSGDLVVLHPDGDLPKPSKQRMRSGKVTLSDSLMVRLTF